MLLMLSGVLIKIEFSKKLGTLNIIESTGFHSKQALEEVKFFFSIFEGTLCTFLDVYVGN